MWTEEADTLFGYTCKLKQGYHLKTGWCQREEESGTRETNEVEKPTHRCLIQT